MCVCVRERENSCWWSKRNDQSLCKTAHIHFMYAYIVQWYSINDNYFENGVNDWKVYQLLIIVFNKLHPWNSVVRLWKSIGTCIIDFSSFSPFSAMQCEENFHYIPCGSPCPQTCKNIGDEPEAYCNSTTCVEGCFCRPGYIRDGKSVEIRLLIFIYPHVCLGICWFTRGPRKEVILRI